MLLLRLRLITPGNILGSDPSRLTLESDRKIPDGDGSDCIGGGCGGGIDCGPDPGEKIIDDVRAGLNEGDALPRAGMSPAEYEGLRGFIRAACAGKTGCIGIAGCGKLLNCCGI
jgi:hypothetical protein